MEAAMHRMIMLRPMQTGLSGYARLQTEAGSMLIQINVRGLSGQEIRAFWYAGEGMVREVGRAAANRRGEAALSTELPAQPLAPSRLMALLIADGADEPRPLMIGLCTVQSAGSLMDAKNALLGLCEKLKKENRKRSAPAEMSPPSTSAPSMPALQDTPPNPKASATDAPAHSASPAKIPTAYPTPQPEQIPHEKKAPLYTRSRYAPADDPPREVFLPAIDPRSYLERYQAKEKAPDGDRELPAQAESASEAMHEPPVSVPFHSSSGVPVDELPALRWPAGFERLAQLFRQLPPCRLMDWPGWRFVRIPGEPNRLWIGYQQQDAQVIRVAYAIPAGVTPPAGQPFQLRRGADGQVYQLLVQRPTIQSPS